jgi:hypothetical protein
MSGSHLVILPDRLDPERLVMEGIDTTDTGPEFSVGQMASFFFARTANWFRWAEAEGKLMLDGKALEIKRDSYGARVFYLEDVEKVAHALAQNGILDARRLQIVLLIIWLQAQLHDLR